MFQKCRIDLTDSKNMPKDNTMAVMVSGECSKRFDEVEISQKIMNF